MKIPFEVQSVIQQLEKAGYQAYIVGGCVRNLLRGIDPEDWDITTNAKPEEIQKIFPKNFYENKFLTVTVQTGNSNPRLKEIEITTYRFEAKYTDKRHPDEIKFAETIEQDLARRDFTINAMAISINSKSTTSSNLKKIESNFKFQAGYKIIDLFNGQKDLKAKIIRAVGNPEIRFNEDALRMLRATRFATVLNQDRDNSEKWEIEPKTLKAIKKNASLLQVISKERIRDELMKIIMARRAAEGIELLRKANLLKHILPELEEGYRVGQNKHHIYDCYEHSLLSLEYAAKQNFNKYVRWAALLHDIAKPRVKRGQGLNSTFYNHEIVGAKITKQALNRLKFPKKINEKITNLVRYHLFYYNVGEVSASSVRRLVQQAGLENMEELLQVRMADRIGSGVPKAEPYKLRHLRYIIEKISQDPISVKMLKINGNEIMKILNIKPGLKIGQILNILLEQVLDDPKKNKKDYLKEKTKKLGQLTEKNLQILADKAKKQREQLEMKKDEMTKKKYWVT